MQIWPTLVLLINSVNGKMRQTMKGFGFSDSGNFSPFTCHFTTSEITDLCEKFLTYLFDQILNMTQLKEEEGLPQITVVFRMIMRMMNGPGLK